MSPSAFLKQIIRSLELHFPFAIDRLRQTYRITVSRINGVAYPCYHSVAQAPYGTKFEDFFSSSKRILFIVHWFEAGGAESFALERMKHFRKSGKNVFVFATKSSEMKKLSLFQENTEYAFPLFTLKPKDQKKYVLEFLRINQIDTVYVHHSHKGYTLLEEIKENFPNIKTIDSLHIIEPIHGGSVHNSVRHSAHLDCHHVISPSLGNYLVRKGISARKVSFFPLSYMSKGSHEAFKKSKALIRVIFIGRIVQQKRPQYLIRIAEQIQNDLKDKGIDSQFDVYGSGNKEVILKYQLERSQVQNFNLHGETHINKEIFENAYALILPSDNEGIPLVCFEATRYGVYTFCTNVGQIADFVHADFLVQHDQPAMIAKRVIDSLENPETYEKSFRKQVEHLHIFDANKIPPY